MIKVNFQKKVSEQILSCSLHILRRKKEINSWLRYRNILLIYLWYMQLNLYLAIAFFHKLLESP